MSSNPLSPLSQVITTEAAIGEQRTTQILVKSPAMRVLQLAIPAGDSMDEHTAPGEITVHCLSGKIRFQAGSEVRELQSGDLIHVGSKVPHSLSATESSLLLVTVAVARPAHS